jgi:enterochelin esterase-like enzyme
MSPMRRLLYTILIASLITACDPLAPSAKQAMPTPTETRAPLPTAIVLPSDTPTAMFTDTPILSTVPTAMTEAPLPTAVSMVQACGEKQGQVVDLTLRSKVVRGGQVVYRVYLPPCYGQSTRRYPYVILMHGSDQDETEWTELLKAHEALEAGIAVQALPPMILVMPRGGVQANTNTFREGASWESVIVNELMPEVEKNLCTWNAREGRAIGGISRGGFWAFLIGFRHPDLFSAIGGHSPFFDAQNAPPAYNPLNLAKTIQFPSGQQPRIWIDAGKDDYARPNIEIFQKTLAGRNLDPGYVMNPTGKHEVPYWASHVSEYLGFYGQTWPRKVEDLPSCLQQ